MSQNLMYLNQLLTATGGGWLPVTMLMGMLLALVFRPNAIHNMFLFRVTCWLLAISVAVGPVLSILMSVTMTTYPGSMRLGGSSGPEFLFACVNALGPIMQGASILCGLFSLLPPMSPRRYESEPVKHPLE